MLDFRLTDFLFPKLDRRLGLRLLALALVCLLFFGVVCRPCVIRGESMRPVYRGWGLTFCWCPSAWFVRPRRGQIVVLRMVGQRVLLLKRIVGLPGEVVEFRDGRLFVDGEPLREEWETLGPCDWNLPPRTVEAGHVYVVGDNRSMDMDSHVFGQIPASRILGVPVW